MTAAMDARAALNAPTLITTSKGDVEVRELSVIDGIMVCDRIATFVLAISQTQGSAGLELVGWFMGTIKSDPKALLGLVAVATNRDADWLAGLGLAEFALVLDAFLDRNADVFRRFLALSDRVRAIGRTATGNGTASTVQPASSTS